jgi:hypothetical protein
LHRLTLMHLPRVVSWFGTLLFEIKSIAAIAMVAISRGARDRLFTAYLVFSRALGARGGYRSGSHTGMWYYRYSPVRYSLSASSTAPGCRTNEFRMKSAGAFALICFFFVCCLDQGPELTYAPFCTQDPVMSLRQIFSGGKTRS